MNKRKIMSLALSLCMIAILAVGGTLAYFTDTESETNVFTVGKVDIDLNELFDKDNAKLKPGIDINKDVTISLADGSEPAYVWYTYAVPAALDNPDDASKNVLHVNHAGANWEDYRENSNYWAEGQTEANPVEKTWKVDYAVEEGVEINGISYNVYSVLYNGVLKTTGDVTTIGMTNVYLDPHVNRIVGENNAVTWVWEENGTQTTIDYNLDQGANIIVTAYAIQAEGFEDVVAAYNAYNIQKGE